MVTHVVFQSDDIFIDYTNDYHSIKAKQDLPIGKLILLEHVVHGDSQYAMGSILYSDELYHTLYPRFTDETKEKLIQEKLEMNAFNFGEFIIASTCAKFNHTCIPNCLMNIADHYKGMKIYGVWICGKVKKGDELFIDYVNSGNHHDILRGHNIQCNCSDKNVMDNAKKALIRHNLYLSFREKNEAFIQNTINVYGESSICKNVIFHQNKAKAHAKKYVKIEYI